MSLHIAYTSAWEDSKEGYGLGSSHALSDANESTILLTRREAWDLIRRSTSDDRVGPSDPVRGN